MAALDQDVVNLAKAIRQVETGNNPKPGASGELPSRYQFMPATWRTLAKKHLGDENAKLSLENENRVAYTQIKEWKDSGYKPDQIASMWNSGKPDWQGKVGVNSAGVKYDVPGYVAKVGNAYKQIKGVTPTTTPAPVPMPTMSADVEAQKQHGAFFAPNTQNPSAIGEALKSVGNIPSSAFGFARGALNMINPVQIAKNVQQIGSDVRGLVQEAGGVGKAATAFGRALPSAAYQTLVPEAARGLVKATGGAITGNADAERQGFEQAQRSLVADPVGSILPFIFAGRAAAGKAGVGAQFDRAVSKVAEPITKPAAAFGRAVAEKVPQVTRFGVSQATGLQPDTISQVIKKPSAFTKEAQASIDRPSLGRTIQSALGERIASLEETGSGYKPIRSSKQPITLRRGVLELQNLIEETTGAKFKEGEIKTTGAARIRDAKDVRALQNLYDVWKPVFQRGQMTTNEFLNLRTDLSKLSKFEREIGRSTELETAAQSIRARLNEAYRPKIEGLKALDESFGAQSGELKTLRKGIVDKDGNLTESAINQIANAAGKGKDLKLARLEEISPGITQKIKVLKAVEDIQHASGLRVGAYTRSALTFGGFASGGILGAVIAQILTSPDLAVPLLRKYGLLKNSNAVQAVVQALKDSGKTGSQIPGQKTEELRPGAFTRKALVENPLGVKKNFERAKGLSKSDQTVESLAFDKIAKQEETILDAYKQKHGKIVNADNFRPMFKEEGYAGHNSAAVQEPASYLAKRAYAEGLKNEGKYAMFTSGMSGAGKTSALKNVPIFEQLSSKASVVLDSNLSKWDSTMKKFAEAEQAGKIPVTFYTYRDLIDGLVNGVVKRMLKNPDEMGRLVPTKEIASNAPGSWEVAQRLQKAGYKVYFVDNSLGAGRARLSSLKELQKKVSYPKDVKPILDAKIKELYDTGRITKKQYEGYTQ